MERGQRQLVGSRGSVSGRLERLKCCRGHANAPIQVTSSHGQSAPSQRAISLQLERLGLCQERCEYSIFASSTLPCALQFPSMAERANLPSVPAVPQLVLRAMPCPPSPDTIVDAGHSVRWAGDQPTDEWQLVFNDQYFAAAKLDPSLPSLLHSISTPSPSRCAMCQ